MMRRRRARRLWPVGLVLLLLCGAPSLAQQYQPEDPVPPDAKGEVSSLKDQVLELKRQVLELKATVFDIHGAASPMKATAQTLEGALQDLGAKVTGQEIKINLAADVLFDFDKADLRPQARPALEKVAAVVRSYPKASVLIEGHTDGKGNDQYNQKLSERRAEAVRKWLLQDGVSAAMTTRGWGKTRPVAPNSKPNGADDPEGRQKNRRVEITVKTG